MLVKILGFLRKQKFWAYIFIKMSSKAPVKILGYFIRTMFLTPKNPWPSFACQNLGTFKKYKDIGLTSYRNLRFSTCQNLGLFHKNHVFWRQKAHGLFCLSKSWAFKENIDFGAYIVSKCQVKHLSKSWVFHKNHVFDTKKTHVLLLLVKILGLLKSTEILGLHRMEILGLARVKILEYFIRASFLTPKTHGQLLLVKIMGFLKSAKT